MLMVFGWIAIGAITGLIPLRRVQWSIMGGILTGVAGGVVGGWVHSQTFSADAAYFTLGSLGAAITGAVMFLVIYGYTAAYRD